MCRSRQQSGSPRMVALLCSMAGAPGGCEGAPSSADERARCDAGDLAGPPPPPSSWQSMLHAMGNVVGFFGRLSFLVDENAHAFHFFISSLLQLLDRCTQHSSPALTVAVCPGSCL